VGGDSVGNAGERGKQVFKSLPKGREGLRKGGRGRIRVAME